VGARGFLYLDSARTSELLAGLEGGTYGVEREERNEESGREVGGKVGVGVLGTNVGVEAGRTSTSARRVERELSQTPESRFSRLTDALRHGDSLKHVSTLDESSWAELEPGQVVEIVASVSIGTLYGLADAVVRAQALNRTFSDEPGGSFREKALCQLVVRLYNIARLIPGVSVEPELIAVIPESPDFRFTAKLDATEIRPGLQAQEDDARVLGKINRKRNRDAELTLLGLYR
jgi:hypothetical protein